MKSEHAKAVAENLSACLDKAQSETANLAQRSWVGWLEIKACRCRPHKYDVLWEASGCQQLDSSQSVEIDRILSLRYAEFGRRNQAPN